MKLFIPLLLIYFSFGCKKSETIEENITETKPTIQIIEKPTDFYQKLSNAAISIIDPEVVYTPDYVGIKYPNGDVPAKTGVCTESPGTFRESIIFCPTIVEISYWDRSLGTYEA